MTRFPVEVIVHPRFEFNYQLTLAHQEDYLTTNFSLDFMLTGGKTDELLNDLGGITTAKQAKAAKIILMNTYYCWDNMRKMEGLSLSLITLCNRAFKRDRYNRSGIGIRPIRAAITTLEEAGLIKVAKGFRSEGYDQGLASTVTPTPKLISWFTINENNLEASPTSAERELIHLKKEWLLKDYDDQRLTHQYRQELQLINTVNAKHSFSYLEHKTIDEVRQPSGRTKHPTVISMEYRRHFNDGWTTGGRLYSHLSGITKEERRTITIDGCQTVELDYGNLQLRIMYSEHGLQPPMTDLYSISGTFTREEMKLASLLVANCKSKTSATNALKKKGYSAPIAIKMLDTFETAHKDVAELFYSEFWKVGMFVESCIGMQVMMAFAEQNKPILNIHDGFRVKVEDEEFLRQCMTQFYSSELGHNPTIDYD